MCFAEFSKFVGGFPQRAQSRLETSPLTPPYFYIENKVGEIHLFVYYFNPEGLVKSNKSTATTP